MAESNSENEKKASGKSSTKRLVRILVIVGVGIPVLVELLTLFNLINVQLIGGEEEQATQEPAVEEVRTFSEGDTLFTDATNPLVMRAMKIKVSARHWRLELNISPVDTAGAATSEDLFSVDSLKLKSGTILMPEQAIALTRAGAGSNYMAEWELPDGDIPQVLYMRSMQRVTPDSLRTMAREFRLGNLPIRYEQE